jgi:hypothetical protein
MAGGATDRDDVVVGRRGDIVPGGGVVGAIAAAMAALSQSAWGDWGWGSGWAEMGVGGWGAGLASGDRHAARVGAASNRERQVRFMSKPPRDHSERVKA